MHAVEGEHRRHLDADHACTDSAPMQTQDAQALLGVATAKRQSREQRPRSTGSAPQAQSRQRAGHPILALAPRLRPSVA